MTQPSAWDYGKADALPMAVGGGLGGAFAANEIAKKFGHKRDMSMMALSALAGAGALGTGGLLWGAGKGALQNAYLGENSGWLPYATGTVGGIGGGIGGAALAKKLMRGNPEAAAILGGMLGAGVGTVGGWSAGGALNNVVPESLQAPAAGGVIGGSLGNVLGSAAGAKGKLPTILGILAGAGIAKKLSDK